MKSVLDPEFRPYGRVITGYDCKELLKAMESIGIPEGVAYEPSIEALEATPFMAEMQNRYYGGLPIQIGYCNGHNDLLNAVEYHRCSEINVAVTSMILMIGKLQDVKADSTYDTSLIEAFYVPQGTIVEMYGTTLHYAPCRENNEGFKCVVVLPKDTNLDLVKELDKKGEDALLFARNKWLIAHEDAKISGAFNGLKGKNLSLADFE